MISAAPDDVATIFCALLLTKINDGPLKMKDPPTDFLLTELLPHSASVNATSGADVAVVNVE